MKSPRTISKLFLHLGWHLSAFDKWCDVMVNMINENTERGKSIVFPLHGYTAVFQV